MFSSSRLPAEEPRTSVSGPPEESDSPEEPRTSVSGPPPCKISWRASSAPSAIQRSTCRRFQNSESFAEHNFSDGVRIVTCACDTGMRPERAILRCKRASPTLLAIHATRSIQSPNASVEKMAQLKRCSPAARPGSIDLRMAFDPIAYEGIVSEILALDGNGLRPMPLVATGCISGDAAARLRTIDPMEALPAARRPKATISGLWVYFSAFEEAHAIAQDLKTKEGAYWHAILHRQEPDPGNAAYWFRQVGSHPVFRRVAQAASEIVKRHRAAEFRSNGRSWDPFAFITFCERARKQPGSPSETAAKEIQLAEWQELLDYCARPRP